MSDKDIIHETTDVWSSHNEGMKRIIKKGTKAIVDAGSSTMLNIAGIAKGIKDLVSMNAELYNRRTSCGGDKGCIGKINYTINNNEIKIKEKKLLLSRAKGN